MAAATLLLLTGAAPATALTPPPPPEKAEIVFSNGGRIVSIQADGSERTVLTRKYARPRSSEWDPMPP
ncbi:MAG: hypothetical protein M3Y45_10030, partial [Actinomycetota bacterium]|nr:hypothetical protein [Actinomycetota bacterium]